MPACRSCLELREYRREARFRSQLGGVSVKVSGLLEPDTLANLRSMSEKLYCMVSRRHSATSQCNRPRRMAEIRTHLESLPQELYDEIHNLVFCALERELWPENLPSLQAVEARNKTSKLTWPDEARMDLDLIVVDTNYRIPAVLRINRQRRLDFASDYYGANRFIFVRVEAGSKFLDILGAEQRSLLAQTLIVEVKCEDRFEGVLGTVKTWAREYGKEVSVGYSLVRSDQR